MQHLGIIAVVVSLMAQVCAVVWAVSGFAQDVDRNKQDISMMRVSQSEIVEKISGLEIQISHDIARIDANLEFIKNALSTMVALR